MGKGSRNRQRRNGDGDGWPGLDGRNPLTLSAERLETLVPAAFDHIMSAGTADGRRSLAACWALGVLAVSELEDPAAVPWAKSPSPSELALVGAVGPPPPSVTADELDATADAWLRQLHAAGANDRLRAFASTWLRLTHHDNPHGHPLHLAFALALADEPLALEPLADRLMPQQVLDADLDADDAYLPGRSRKIPGTRSTRVELAGEAAEALRPGFDALVRQAEALGMPSDATFGEILAAAGHDVGGEQELLEMAQVMEQVSPWSAHAFVATDGLILTEMNEHLVDPADAQRWVGAGGAYQAVFDRLDELEALDRDDPADEPAILDAEIDAAATLLDELVALVDDGAMVAYDRLLAHVEAHPQGAGLHEQVRSVAFTELSVEVDEDSFRGALGEDVRRLVGVRFADRDPGMPAAADRALAVVDSLVDGDLPLSEAVDDPRRELAVWVALVAVWRANSA